MSCSLVSRCLGPDVQYNVLSQFLGEDCIKKKGNCWMSYTHAVTDPLMRTSFKLYIKHLKGMLFILGYVGSGEASKGGP